MCQLILAERQSKWFCQDHKFPTLASFIQLVQPGLVNVVAKHGKYRLAKQPHYIGDLTDGPTCQNCNAQKEIYTLFLYMDTFADYLSILWNEKWRNNYL